MKTYERGGGGETALSPQTSMVPTVILGAGISSQAPFILQRVRICETTDIQCLLYSDFVSFHFVLTEWLSLGDLAVVI